MFEIQYASDSDQLNGYVGSFGQGYKPLPKPMLKFESEADILAHALWLSRQGRIDEADAFLDEHC